MSKLRLTAFIILMLGFTGLFIANIMTVLLIDRTIVGLLILGNMSLLAGEAISEGVRK